VVQRFLTYRHRTRSRSGWTLIELLVVLAIITILAAFSVPVVNMFSRNDLRDSARMLYTLLRAARVYAVNNNVETAVVYFLDNPFSKEADGTVTFSPMEDSVSDTWVRTIVAATVMYRLPAEMPVWPILPPDVQQAEDSDSITGSEEAVDWRKAGIFVPTPGMGDIVSFPDGYSLLLNLPREDFEKMPGGSGTAQERALNALGSPVYQVDGALGYAPPEKQNFLFHYNRQMERGAGTSPLLENLGMRPVYVYPETPSEGIYVDSVTSLAQVMPLFDPDLVRPHIAHVFTPRGSLKTRVQGVKERYRLLVAPLPSAFPEDRLITYPDGEIDAFGALVEINRGTGYVRLEQ
jgi:prepilin-type N-terminal cleavage/methylation domain-containing protein